MKKIITGLSMIALSAAIAVGSTVAFFSDTETSKGNTFTAGGIDLTVDSLGGTRNGELVSNSNWFAKDLIAEKFFDFSDVKPGDTFGRNLSLHVENNPAWVCLLPLNKHDDENTLTNPEIKAEDNTAGTVVGGLGGGELGHNIHVLAWRDTNPNGRHDQNEPFLVDSFFDIFTDISLHDSTTGNGPLDPTVATEMIQMDLCAGKHVIAPGTGFGGAVSCDGKGMGNQSQTDSLSADLQLYVVQSRNNPDFKCSDLNPNPNNT